jgi:hypothetical protein
LPARTWKAFMVQATQGMPIRPLPTDEGARVASAAPPSAEQPHTGILGGLESLLHSIFGGGARAAQ